MKKKSIGESAILCVFLCVLFLLCASLKNTPSEQYASDAVLVFLLCASLKNTASDAVLDLATEQTESMREGSTEASGTLLSGSRHGGSTELSPTPQQDAFTQESCIQMALYIQEGFRTYGIEGSYEAYFGPIEEEEGIYSCDILLDGTDGLWSETLAYTYDAGTEWYNFREGGQDRHLGDDLYQRQNEPIFGLDSFSDEGKLEEDSSYAQDLRDTAIYQTTISQGADPGSPIRYYGKTGPVEHDDRFSVSPLGETGLPYSLNSCLYTYYDERMGIDIHVSYPQILYYGEPELGEAVNEALRHVCLYDTPLDTEVEWNPASKIYTYEERSYKLTRQDEKYLSVLVYTYFDTRDAWHPSHHTYGLTIDMETGMPVHLSDVVGEEQTIQTLIDSGAFHGGLAEISEEDWIKEISFWWVNAYEALDDYDDAFYLTDKGLGLITYASQNYVRMEADYEDLGLAEFLP